MSTIKAVVPSTLLALLLSSGMAQAAILDFTDAFNDSDPVAQSYGDGATWDVSYADLSISPTYPSLIFSRGSYYVSNDAVYAGTSGPNSHGRITITPTAGYEVILDSFDLAPYRSNSLDPFTADTSWAVYTVGGIASFTLAQGLGTLTTITSGLTSSTGVVIEWKEDAFDVAIDNIRFNVRAVPEPGTFALVAAALAVVASLARQQRART